MHSRPTVGLLPLYLKLYDTAVPEALPRFDSFLADVTGGLRARGLTVVEAGVCRVAEQFAAAVRQFEQHDVDLIVTLHLAYSPSLEAVDALAASRLPILLLDTTMHYDFGPGVDPDRIMYDHGIHGVQDLACMLRRRGKPFDIVAGHVTKSDVLDRAAGIARAALAAHAFRHSRVLRIGPSFKGMGDFAVSEAVLADAFGIHVDTISLDVLAAAAATVSDAEVNREVALDREQFDLDLCAETHRRSVRIGLALRRLIEQGSYDALSMNFLAFESSEGPVDTVPFLEASKAMGRGLGYAGEGDVLTAAVVGALNRAFGRTTFTEIFCPDWEGGSLFLSHMGEINPRVAAQTPRLYEKPFPFTPAQNPATLACAIAPGPAVLVNLSPGPNDTFRLIVAPVEVLAENAGPAMRDCIRGWIRPGVSIEEFLERYSRLGGTHHSALILGEHREALEAFAGFLAVECVVST